MSKFLQIDSYKPNSVDYQALALPVHCARCSSLRAHQHRRRIHYVAQETLHELINHRLGKEDPSFIELRSKQFLVDGNTAIAKDLLAIKVRSRYARLCDRRQRVPRNGSLPWFAFGPTQDALTRAHEFISFERDVEQDIRIH